MIDKTKGEQYQKRMPFGVLCKALIGNKRCREIETTFVGYTGSQFNLLNKKNLFLIDVDCCCNKNKDAVLGKN